MTIRSKVIAVEHISRAIIIVRGQRVILDHRLAPIHGVTTKRLNEQVKGNIQRFPGDFMFRLTVYENARSRSQFATLVGGRGRNVKYLPYAFTEYGAIQAANVLRSPRARRGNEPETQRQFKSVCAALRALMTPPTFKARSIGFTADLESREE